MSMDHQTKTFTDLEGNEVPWSPLSSAGSCGSSSTFSWTDETDLNTTRELEEQFQKFEEALYLEASPNDLPQSLQDEVKIWSEYSPHIRVRGNQVKLNERPETKEGNEDDCDVNYEEVIAFHESPKSSDESPSLNSETNDVYTSVTELKILREDLKNDIVNTLFNKTWPEVLEDIEPIVKYVKSAGKNKTYINDTEKVQTNLETIKYKNILSRSNSSRSYLRDNVDCGSEYNCVLSSRGVRLHNDNFPIQLNREIHRVPYTSLPKTRVNRVSTFSAKLPVNSGNFLNRSKPPVTSTKKIRTFTSNKTVILPPIEALAIKPNKPDKRVNSAMVRFTKTLPRVRPNTSKKKNVGMKSLNIGFKEMKKETDITIEEPVHNFTLEVIGTKSNTLNRNRRWH